MILKNKFHFRTALSIRSKNGACPRVMEWMCFWKCVCVVKFHNMNPIFLLTPMLEIEKHSYGNFVRPQLKKKMHLFTHHKQQEVHFLYSLHLNLRASFQTSWIRAIHCKIWNKIGMAATLPDNPLHHWCMCIGQPLALYISCCHQCTHVCNLNSLKK